MAKTANDIVTLALRQIGVVAVDEVAVADEYVYAHDVYEGEFERLKTDHGFTWTWTYDEVPDALFVPMANFLASNLTAYGRPLPSRANAVMGLRSYAFPDDRDGADLDGDGTITEAEQNASDRAAYY